jgi:hypothetical protein
MPSSERQAPPGNERPRLSPSQDARHKGFIENGSTAANGAPHPSLQTRRASEARRLRRQRYSARIWPLGDRVLFGLVDHIAGRFDLEDEVVRLLDRFAGLDLEALRALGADRLPCSPLRAVRGGTR